MTFDPTRPVQTRDGRKARIYATDGFGDYSIHGAVEQTSGWQHCVWTADGLYHKFNNKYSPSDLVNVPETLTFYVNVDRARAAEIFRSHEEAEDSSDGYAILVAHPITITLPIDGYAVVKVEG